jgi:tetratricopeptide (TPR) repeat protein
MSMEPAPDGAVGRLSFRERLRGLKPVSIPQALQFLVTAVPVAAAAVALVWQLGVEVFDDSLAIEPISVPSSLSGEGYTPEVVAQRLNDAVAAIMTKADTRMRREHIAAGEPQALVPASGSQFASLISSALHFFHLSSRSYVTGEIVEKHGRFSLTVRMGGRLAGSKTLGPTDDPDALFALAAREIVWRSQPYILASYDAKNPALAQSEVDSIIGRYPESDPNVAYAHNLKGIILHDMKQQAAAMAEYREAIRLAPRLAVPHHNLGNLYEGTNRHAEAIEEFKTSIALDPGFALPYQGLGGVFLNEKRYGEAIAQYKIAIGIDPSFTIAHLDMGVALLRSGDTATGLRELRISVAQDPSRAFLHKELAYWLARLQDWDGAIVQYRAALAIAPNDADTHFRLVDAVMFKAKAASPDHAAALLAAACDEAREAARLKPDSQLYADGVQKLCF